MHAHDPELTLAAPRPAPRRRPRHRGRALGRGSWLVLFATALAVPRPAAAGRESVRGAVGLPPAGGVPNSPRSPRQGAWSARDSRAPTCPGGARVSGGERRRAVVPESTPVRAATGPILAPLRPDYPVGFATLSDWMRGLSSPHPVTEEVVLRHIAAEIGSPDAVIGVLSGMLADPRWLRAIARHGKSGPHPLGFAKLYAMRAGGLELRIHDHRTGAHDVVPHDHVNGIAVQHVAGAPYVNTVLRPVPLPGSRRTGADPPFYRQYIPDSRRGKEPSSTRPDPRPVRLEPLTVRSIRGGSGWYEPHDSVHRLAGVAGATGGRTVTVVARGIPRKAGSMSYLSPPVLDATLARRRELALAKRAGVRSDGGGNPSASSVEVLRFMVLDLIAYLAPLSTQFK